MLISQSGSKHDFEATKQLCFSWSDIFFGLVNKLTLILLLLKQVITLNITG